MLCIQSACMSLLVESQNLIKEDLLLLWSESVMTENYLLGHLRSHKFVYKLVFIFIIKKGYIVDINLYIRQLGFHGFAISSLCEVLLTYYNLN